MIKRCAFCNAKFVTRTDNDYCTPECGEYHLYFKAYFDFDVFIPVSEHRNNDDFIEFMDIKISKKRLGLSNISDDNKVFLKTKEVAKKQKQSNINSKRGCKNYI